MLFSSGAARRRDRFTLLATTLGVAPLAVSCSNKPPGALVIAVETDVPLPQDVDSVEIKVEATASVQFDNTYPVGMGALLVPATLTLLPGSTAGEPVTIRLLAYRGNTVRMLRQAVTTVPTTRIATLLMPIQWLDFGMTTGGSMMSSNDVTSTCPSGQTPIEGSCVSDVVDSSTLPTYSAASVFGGGDGSGDGTCFDLVKCVPSATLAAVDKEKCTIANARDVVNVAIVVPSADGECNGKACLVPVPSGTPGWTLNGGTISLPPAICTNPAVAGVVVSTTSCPTFGSATPLCGSWSSVSVGTSSGGTGSGGAASSGSSSGGSSTSSSSSAGSSSSSSSSSQSCGVDMFTAGSVTQTVSGANDMTLADVNGDGQADLIVPSPTTNQLTVLLGSVSIVSSSVYSTAGQFPTTVRVGDINGDGHPDLVVTNDESDTFSVLYNTGTGGSFMNTTTFYTTASGPNALALGDFNADGLLDVATGDHTAGVVGIHMQNAAGATSLFADEVTYPGGGADLVAGILGAPPAEDLASATYTGGGLDVFRNNGTGMFATTPYAAMDTPLGIVTADFNGDSLQDIMLALNGPSSSGCVVSLFLNTGGGVFALPAYFKLLPAPAAPCARITQGDFNGDGQPDIAVASGSSIVMALNGVGGPVGTFAPSAVSSLAVGGSDSVVGLDVGDVDGNATLDIAWATGSGVGVLFNTCTP